MGRLGNPSTRTASPPASPEAKEGVVLVLSRKPNQSIMIGNDIRILVVELDGDHVKLGIEAPRDVPVHRFEVFTEIRSGELQETPPQ